MSPLPPECEQLLIVGYVLGNLSPAEAMLFEELVADNPELMEQVTEFQQSIELAYTTPEVAPPPQLKDRVLKACLQEETLKPETVKPETEQKLDSAAIEEREEPEIREKRSFWSRLLGAIALIIIALLGYNNYRFWQILQVRNAKNIELADVTLRNYTLTSPDVPEETKARLIVDPVRLKAVLTADNLPSLPSDKVYALWTVVGQDVPYTTDEKGAILTAVFQPNESGNITKEIVVPQPHFTGDEIAKIAITVENKSAPQAHTGSIFIATENLN